MFQEPISKAVGIYLRTDSAVDIIVHFDIADTIFIYHSVNYRSCIVLHFRISEIQLISALVGYNLSMSSEKPALRNLVDIWAVKTNCFNFQPKTRNHTFFADIFNWFLNASRISLRRRFPFTYASPPVSVRVPSTVNAEIFASCICRCVNKRKQFFCCRIPKQTVHVIVKNNCKFFIIFIRAADLTAVFRHLYNCFFKSSINNRDGRRHCDKRFTRLQAFMPLAFPFSRAG